MSRMESPKQHVIGGRRQGGTLVIAQRIPLNPGSSKARPDHLHPGFLLVPRPGALLKGQDENLHTICRESLKIRDHLRLAKVFQQAVVSDIEDFQTSPWPLIFL